MKLDRNQNNDGHGKYALVKIRKINQIDANRNGTYPPDFRTSVHNAIITLKNAGCLHFGDEGAGEQFFVMKYKDRFAAAGLAGYADAISQVIRASFSPEISAKLLSGEALTTEEEKQRIANLAIIRDLSPYWRDILAESITAANEGKQLPD